MAYISVTNTFVAGNVADPTEVNTNFDDIVDGLSDATKSLNMDDATFGGDLAVTGYSTLGGSSPALQVLELAVTTPAAAGGSTTTAHGVTSAKIIGITGMVKAAATNTYYPMNSSVAAGSWTAYINSSNQVVMTYGGSATLVLATAIKLYIIYIQ